MKNSLIALGALLVGCAHLQATILVSDNFPTNGNLVGTTPAVGQAWAPVNAATPALVVSSNALIIPNANAQDVTSQYAAAQTGSIFAGFDFTLTTLPTTNAGGSYIAAFRDGVNPLSGEYIGRFLIRRISGSPANEFQVGVSTHTDTLSDAGSILWGVNLTLNTQYHIVLRFDTATDNSTLWVSPVNIASTSVTSSDVYAVTDVDGFGFRSGSASHGAASIDNLRVGTTFTDVMPIPEPSTYAMFGLAVGFLLWRVRSKRLRY